MYDKNTTYVYTWKKIHFSMKIIFLPFKKNVTLVLKTCHPRHTMLVAFEMFLKYGPLKGFLGTKKTSKKNQCMTFKKCDFENQWFLKPISTLYLKQMVIFEKTCFWNHDAWEAAYLYSYLFINYFKDSQHDTILKEILYLYNLG